MQFPITPTGPAAYRLVFEGTPVFHRSHSGIVRIGVRPVVTATAAPEWINPGETATVSGVATLAGVPLIGASVDLVARRAGHSGPRHVVGSGTTAADGSVAITDTPDGNHGLPARGPARDRRTARGQPRRAGEGARGPAPCRSGAGTPEAGFVVSGILRGDHHTVRHAQVNLETLASGRGDVDGGDLGLHRQARQGGVPGVQLGGCQLPSFLRRELQARALHQRDSRQLRPQPTDTGRSRRWKRALSRTPTCPPRCPRHARATRRLRDAVAGAAPAAAALPDRRGDEAPEDLAWETWMHVVTGLAHFEGTPQSSARGCSPSPGTGRSTPDGPGRRPVVALGEPAALPSRRAGAQRGGAGGRARRTARALDLVRPSRRPRRRW